MPNINYQDPLHLAVMVQGRLSVDRPHALTVVTSNPGEDDKHYIALVQRVYSNKNDLSSFVGYITYRYREVRFRKKESYLPAFSSIEIRDADFNEYNPPVKIHFDPKKVQAEDGNLYQKANLTAVAAALPGGGVDDDLLRNEIGKGAFEKVYAKVLDLIDHKI
jgi:hypothetical protein